MPEPEAPPGPLVAQLGACSVCDAVYLVSGRRDTSPCHGADPILTFASLLIEESGRVTGAWGPLPLPCELIEMPPKPEGAPPVVPEPEGALPAEPVGAPLAAPPYALLEAEEFLEDPERAPEALRAALLAAGAEAEDVETAIGRLTAVRDFLRKIASQGA